MLSDHHPQSPDTLTLGSGDGIWTIARRFLNESPIIFSCGIGEDLSWDLAMIEQFQATVHAFDPTPISLKWLRSQQLPPQLRTYPVGLATFDGAQDFTLPLWHGVSFSARARTWFRRRSSCAVLTFHSLLELTNVTRIDVLKLDIEGAEYDVLPDILKSKVLIGQILIEFHSRLLGREGDQKTQAALELLDASDYELFHVSPRGLEYAFLNRSLITKADPQPHE